MMRFGMARRSYRHNPWCGDDAFTYQDEARILLAVVDGLGHHLRAAHAAEAAVTRLAECAHLPAPEMLHAVKEALADTVGAALTLAIIDRARGRLQACGVGNVELHLVTPRRVFRFVGEPGIVGEGVTPCRTELFAYRPGDLVILFSDGVRSAFGAGGLRDIRRPDPQRIANRILQEYARPSDDALVLVGWEAADGEQRMEADKRMGFLLHAALAGSGEPARKAMVLAIHRKC